MLLLVRDSRAIGLPNSDSDSGYSVSESRYNFRPHRVSFRSAAQRYAVIASVRVSEKQSYGTLYGVYPVPLQAVLPKCRWQTARLAV